MAVSTLSEGDLMELVSLGWKAEWEGSLSYALENWPWHFTDVALAEAAQARDARALGRALRDHDEAIAAWEDRHREDGADLISAHQWRMSLAAGGLRELNWGQAGVLVGILHGEAPEGQPGADLFLDWLRTGGLLDHSGGGWALTALGDRLAREAEALTMWVFRTKDCGCCFLHLASADPYLGELATEADAWAALERTHPGRGDSLSLEGLPFREFASRVVGQPACAHR